MTHSFTNFDLNIIGPFQKERFINTIFVTLGNKIDYISDKNIYLFKQKLFGIHPSSVLQYVQ